MIACHAKALGSLSDTLADFLHAKDVRLLAVSVVEEELRAGVLSLVRAHELHPACGRGVIVLETPFDENAPGWDERASEIRAHHGLRREVMARAGDTLAELGPAPRAQGLEGFGATVKQLQRTAAPPLDGWILVLAPGRIGDEAGFQDAVRMLFAASGLQDLRWITVEPGKLVTQPLVASLGKAATSHRVAVDPAERDRQWEDLVRAMAEAPPDGAPQAAMGGAWPKGVVPPPRPDAPDTDLGPGEGPLSPAQAARLRELVLRAALAARRDDGKDEAIVSQREASALCLARGLEREGLMLEITLGTYHQRYREEPAALDVWRDVVVRAEKAEIHDVAATALLASAAVHRIGGRAEQALEGYSAAAAHARRAGEPRLVAIEALRMTGEVALELGKTDVAFQALRDAVSLAEDRPPAEIRASSAAEAARMLADQYRRAGRATEAEALLDQANHFEGGASRAS